MLDVQTPARDLCNVIAERRVSVLSDDQGIPEQDPAERLAHALNRIALALERREAELPLTTTAGPTPAHSPPAPLAAETATAADLDGLISRLRTVLEAMPVAGRSAPHGPGEE